MSHPKIFADFHNADKQDRLRLNCVGTIEDLNRQAIKLQNGRSLTVYSEELEADGVVQYSEEEGLWVAVIDWQQIREVEDMNPLDSTVDDPGFEVKLQAVVIDRIQTADNQD